MNPLPLYFRGLTPELQKYAEDTIGETAEKKAEALSDFRKLIKEKKNLNCRDDDVFLLRFLRTKKFDVEAAFKVLNNYYALLAKYKGVFSGKTIEEVKKVAGMNALVGLPHRLPPGSHLSVFKIGNLDLSEASAIDYVAFQLIYGEVIMESESTQVCGGVNIVDFRDITLQHYTQILSVSFLSLVITILQDCWPERIRAVHFMYEPALLKFLYKLFKPVLKTKFKERLHFHGNNLDSLHQHVSKEFLPEEFGGILGPLDSIDYLSYIYSQDSFINRINTYGLIDKNS